MLTECQQWLARGKDNLLIGPESRPKKLPDMTLRHLRALGEARVETQGPLNFVLKGSRRPDLVVGRRV